LLKGQSSLKQVQSTKWLPDSKQLIILKNTKQTMKELTRENRRDLNEKSTQELASDMEKTTRTDFGKVF
jgi:hypothetical protein